jgi:hypothetical protein
MSKGVVVVVARPLPQQLLDDSREPVKVVDHRGKQALKMRLIKAARILLWNIQHTSKSVTLTTRMRQSADSSRRIEAAASASIVSVSPEHASTTSGSSPSFVLAHCQIEAPTRQ